MTLRALAGPRAARLAALPALIVAALSACQGAQSPRREEPAATGSAAAPASAASPEETVRALIKEFALTTLRPECLSLERVPGDSGVVFDVRERHDASCGGDPATAPRLFSIGLDTLTGAAWSDARSDDGSMRPLRAGSRAARP